MASFVQCQRQQLRSNCASLLFFKAQCNWRLKLVIIYSCYASLNIFIAALSRFAGKINFSCFQTCNARKSIYISLQQGIVRAARSNKHSAKHPVCLLAANIVKTLNCWFRQHFKIPAHWARLTSAWCGTAPGGAAPHAGVMC